MRQRNTANSQPRARVAIIGTGLAGLTTAYLLRHDKQERYDVTLFEQGDSLSLDAASVTLKNDATGLRQRVNIPSRSLNRVYYRNLTRLYEYLGISLLPIKYTFVFTEAKADEKDGNTRQQPNADPTAGAYFIFPSVPKLLLSLHYSRHWLQQLWKMLVLLVYHIWFMACCFIVEPRSASTMRGRSDGEKTVLSETLHAYLRRTWVSQYYVSHYLLPVLTALCTCSHAEVLDFPASDIIDLVKRTLWQTTYITDGVHQVQSKLTQGIGNILLQSRVTRVQKVASGLLVRWETREDGREVATEQVFDHVVLAVTPNAAAAIFKPASYSLSPIPTASVVAAVIDPTPKLVSAVRQEQAPLGNMAANQFLTFRTDFSRAKVETEVWHFLATGAISSTGSPTCTTNAERMLHTAQFTRTLRTVKSRATVQDIFRAGESSGDGDDEKWVNGQGNVWVAGSWCWDGMVLLEGCVVSAMRVADALGVEVPWR